MKKSFWILVCLCICSTIFAQEKTPSTPVYPLVTADSIAQRQWVDSIYNSMSLQEKVGQLFMVDIFSSKPKRATDYIKHLIEEYHIGGVIFSKGGPVQQARLTNAYQAASRVPLMIGQDAEWGLAMRLDSTYAFPWNMTLGAIENNKLIEITGRQIGRHAKRLGVNINFAPDIDINTNPDNPIIGNRSFGENRENVAQKGIAFAKGMESVGVLASAKHFPGHGDTEVDSHKALPILNFSAERLDSIELYPFKKITQAGISSVMIGHLEIPAWDSRKGHPASLSKPIITGILKERLGYKGLIFTDALNMRGVANYDEPGKTSLDALLAGNDMLLIPRSVPKGVARIVKAYEKGVVTETRLAHSVKKILMAKYKAGLNHYKPVEIEGLVDDLNTRGNDLLYATLLENAITVIKNDKAILPIKNLDQQKIAYVHFGNDSGDDFYKMLRKYADVDKVEASHIGDLLERLKHYNLVIVGLHKSNANPWKSYKFTDQELVWLHQIALNHRTILSVFASPYALLDMRSTANLEGVVIGYQNSKIGQEKTAQVIFGALPAKGKLPVSVGKNFPEGTQYKTKAIQRLSYGIPESVGVSSEALTKIDSIANDAVAKRMTPGMQVLVARKGKVIFQKSYGYHTYAKEHKVKNTDIYDIASMTKVVATLPLLMELQEVGILKLDAPLKKMMPYLRGSNKANLSLRRTLSHYAGFKPWIPFYRKTLDENGKPSPKYYRTQAEGNFTVKVADDLYMRKDYQDSIYQVIVDSDLLRQEEYKYSGLPFYLFKRFLEEYYHEDLNQLTQNRFYKSLGAYRLGFLPLQRFDKQQIIPAEVDDFYRHQTIWGTVDDEGAAMFGGIAGNAGLFSNANAVAKLLQMFLNGGIYGGKRYLKAETIDRFNTRYYADEEVRRGLGFDKPQLDGPGPACDYASAESFGHTGFTGTIGWVDPKEDLVYVCLSNRIFPERSNHRFISEDIRTKIEAAIYEAIIDGDYK